MNWSLRKLEMNVKGNVEENPDIEDVITYVNKKGEVVEKRRLTDEEKRRFKPKALFQSRDQEH